MTQDATQESLSDEQWLRFYLQQTKAKESIGIRFGQVVARHPQKVALQYERTKVSFSKLDSAANGVAAHWLFRKFHGWA